MRPVVKLTRGCGCLIILLLLAGFVLCIMQKTTLGLYISFTGLILLFPYMGWGLLVAYSDTIEKQKENANNNTDDESATMTVIAAHKISERLRK